MSNPPNHSLIQRTIVKSAKRVIVASGMNQSTRSGSKALDYLAKKLSEQCSLAGATQLGEELGEKVVALSQQMGRQNLDQGVIRQLVLNKQVPIPTELQLVPVAVSPKPPAQAKAAEVKPVPPKAEPPELKPAEPKPELKTEAAEAVVPQSLADVKAELEVEDIDEDIDPEPLVESELTEAELEIDAPQPIEAAEEEVEDELVESELEPVLETVDLDEVDGEVDADEANKDEADEDEDEAPAAELDEQPEAVEAEGAEIEGEEFATEPDTEDTEPEEAEKSTEIAE